MRLTADQELRKDLLFFALGRQPDVEAAIEMANRMERFVLRGCQAGNGQYAEFTVEAEAPAGDSPAPLEADAQEAPSQVRSSDGPADEPHIVRKRRWSEADDSLLKQRWHSDCSLEEIASELERTVPSLYSRARALGMSKRSHNAKESQEPVSESPKHNDHRRSADNACADDEAGTAATTASAAPDTPLRQVIERERYHRSGVGGAKKAGGGEGTFGRKAVISSLGMSAVDSAKCGHSQFFVDPIIQFLRSRDYSVVHVGEGQFRLDGRRVMNADELREKANQVRKSLGKPPFESFLEETAG